MEWSSEGNFVAHPGENCLAGGGEEPREHTHSWLAANIDSQGREGERAVIQRDRTSEQRD